MRTEEEIRAKIQQTQRELQGARRRWREVVRREFSSPMTTPPNVTAVVANAHDLYLFNAVIGVCEAEIDALRWVLGLRPVLDSALDDATPDTPNTPERLT